MRRQNRAGLFRCDLDDVPAPARQPTVVRVAVEQFRGPEVPAAFNRRMRMGQKDAADPLTSSPHSGASSEHPKLTVAATFAKSSSVICTK